MEEIRSEGVEREDGDARVLEDDNHTNNLDGAFYLK